MRSVVGLALLALSPAWGAAQSVTTGSLVQSYTVSETADLRLRSIRLLTLPLVVRVPLRSWMDLVASGAWADGTMQLATGERSGTRGWTDTRVALDMVFSGVRMSASTLVPTGSVVASGDEAMLVGLLSTDLLPFALTQWGTGGGYAADLGYALRLDQTTLGLTVGASVLNESTPITGPLTYRPGTQLRAQGSFEAPAGAAGVVAMRFGFQSFSADTYGGRNLFRAGERWEAAVSYAFPFGPRESVLVYGGVSQVAGGVSEVGTYQLDVPGFSSAVVDSPARKVFKAGSEMRFARGLVHVMPRAEIRVLRREDGIGQGWVGSLGGRAEIGVLGGGRRRSVVAEPSLAIRIGRLVVADEVDSAIFGLEAGLALRWERGR